LILGFILVSGIESKLILSVLAEREKYGVFLDFEDLVKRTYIPLEQLVLIIRIGGLRDFPESRKQLLWKAHLYHNRVKDKVPVPLLFEQERKTFELPSLSESNLELAFEQMELLGFPLCNPFELLAEIVPTHTRAKEIPQFIGLRITTFGYLVALKQSRTSKGEAMFFGTFIDAHGDIIDTVHFPETARKYPFYGKGIYQLVGVISEEFGYFTLEIGQMTKQAFMEDVRFSEENTAV
jgi:DNA polymerase-3 subunit alpha